MLCPRCSYDLTGLPEVHACPECGLNCDPNMVAIELRSATPPYIALAWTAVFAVLVLWFTVRMGSWTWERLFFLAGAGVNTLLGLYRSFGTLVGGSRLVVNYEGLHFRLSRGDNRTVPWNEVGAADRTWVTGTLRIRGSDGRTVFVCPIGEFNGKRMVLQSIAEINRLKKVHVGGEAS